MPSITQGFNYFAYTNDDGVVYQIKLAVATGIILGASAVAVGTYPKWPYKFKDLRHVRGQDSSKTLKRRLVVPNLSDPIYSSEIGGAWTDEQGNSIIRTGRFGERKPLAG